VSWKEKPCCLHSFNGEGAAPQDECFSPALGSAAQRPRAPLPASRDAGASSTDPRTRRHAPPLHTNGFVSLQAQARGGFSLDRVLLLSSECVVYWSVCEHPRRQTLESLASVEARPSGSCLPCSPLVLLCRWRTPVVRTASSERPRRRQRRLRKSMALTSLRSQQGPNRRCPWLRQAQSCRNDGSHQTPANRLPAGLAQLPGSTRACDAGTEGEELLLFCPSSAQRRPAMGNSLMLFSCQSVYVSQHSPGLEGRSRQGVWCLQGGGRPLPPTPRWGWLLSALSHGDAARDFHLLER